MTSLTNAQLTLGRYSSQVELPALRRSAVGTLRALPFFLASALAAFVAGNPLFALNPDRQITQYAHTAWRVQDGYFGSSPFSIAQTTDGYILIGTRSGIVRFDGVRFSPWNPVGGEQIRTAFILSLLGTKNGSLWIGTDSGLWRWQDQHLTRYFEGDTLPVLSLAESESGRVWVGRRNGDRSESLCDISAQQTHCYGESDGFPRSCCASVTEGHAGDLWLNTGKAVLRWRPHSLAVPVFALNPSLDQTAVFIRDLALGENDAVWIGVSEPGKRMGLELLAGSQAQPYKTASWDGSTVGVYGELTDSHKVLWVATRNQGLYRIHNGRVDHFGSADGMSGDDVVNLFEDREGDIWAITTKGVDCFRDLKVSTFSTREGLSALEIDSILATADGTLWIGGDESLDAFRGQDITSYRSGKQLPGHQVSVLFEDHGHNLWVGVENRLFNLNKGIFSEVRRPNGEPIGFVTDLAEDSQNTIWAEGRSNSRELLQIENLRLTHEFPAPRMPAARKVAADLHDGIWLGLMNGDLARYRQGKLEVLSYPHGPSQLVNQLDVEPDGSVLGATSAGLIGWLDGKRRVLTSHNGLPCDSVNAFVRDSDGALWLYMQCGLVQVSAQDSHEWWDHPNIELKVRTLDYADGIQPGIAQFRGATRTHDGKLWFANETGVQMIDPAHMTINTVPPPVHVEEVSANGRIILPADQLHLPALTRNLSIRYTALSFVAPQKVLFKYMLEGQDTTWQDAGTRREAFYTNLAPRSYRFRVIACNNDGLWNSVGDSFSFTIEPAYYQTKWFSSLLVLLALGSFWAFYLSRIRQAQAQIAQRLGAKLEERERIARELHDTLLQGFQGLMLRFQAVMNVLPKDGPAQTVMEAALNRADEVLLEGRQRVKNLRNRETTSDDLPFMLTKSGEEFGQHRQAHFSLSVVGSPLKLDQAVNQDIYLIGREAIANAFQHAEASNIEVEVTYSHSLVRLRIRDDGKGVTQAILDRGREGHWGLTGMRERASKIGAKLRIWSNVGAGTEIELEISTRIAHPRVPFATRWLRKSRPAEEA